MTLVHCLYLLDFVQLNYTINMRGKERLPRLIGWTTTIYIDFSGKNCVDFLADEMVNECWNKG